MYHIDGKKFKNLVGSRAEVFHGTAYKTCYGKDCLKKKDLMKSKNDRMAFAKSISLQRKRSVFRNTDTLPVKENSDLYTERLRVAQPRKLDAGVKLSRY